MAKKSARHVSNKSVFIILGISLVLAISFTIYKSYLTPEPIQIMAIDPIKDGQTIIEGVIQPNMSPEEKGSFILTLRDTRIVKLDVKGIDHLIGLPVTVSGTITTANSEYSPISMNVESIIVPQE